MCVLLGNQCPTEGAYACVGCKADAHDLMRAAGEDFGGKQTWEKAFEPKIRVRPGMHCETNFRSRIAHSQTRRSIHLLGAVHLNHCYIAEERFIWWDYGRHSTLWSGGTLGFLCFLRSAASQVTHEGCVLTTGTRAGRNKEVVSVRWHLSHFALVLFH